MLASSRGQRSATIIAPQKPTTLSTGKQHEAERKAAARDDNCENPQIQQKPSNISKESAKSPLSDLDLENSSRHSQSSFENCKEFLRNSGKTTVFSSSSTSSYKATFPSSKSVSNIRSYLVEEKGILTDVHCGSNSRNSVGCGVGVIDCVEDEVEIVSLLEERIPRYKLRADSITKFGGYSNEDFVGIPYPVLQDYSPVTPEQAYLTLGYFLLSGERVSQMTKTYADADALQRLLEEKEKDLELAARIGQQLLEQNRSLEERVAVLEAENKDSQESITQLKHDLLFKTQLLELYNDSSESAENSKAGTPIGSVATVLERRVACLEEDNRLLRTEAARMAEDVEKTEAEEKYLVEDAIKRLGETNSRITYISDELQKKTEEAAAQQEELMMLVDEVKSLQEVNKELFAENTELHKIVDTLKTCQDELTTELSDLKDNYVEVVSILKETQDQLRDAQKKKDSGADVVSVFDSLAYEIESSVARQRRASDYFRKTFDTVRCANTKLHDGSFSNSALMSSASSSGYHSGCSGLPSLESSHELVILNSSMTSCLTLGSDLGSSICPSPGGSTPSGTWRLPEKLQIVKPLEGSSTLQVWSALATPHLGNLLDKRPGVQMRVERPMGEIGMHQILSLTEAETISTLQNVVSTPAIFTYVTTATNWDLRESTTTVFSADMSTTVSTCSLPSSRSVSDRGSPTPTLSGTISCSGSTDFNMPTLPSTDHLKMCETPQNSPMDGNTRPCSPTLSKSDPRNNSSSRTLKTLKSVYDTLCNTLGGLSQSSRSMGRVQPQKYDLMTKIGRVEVAFESSRLQAPPKPGTGVLDDILLHPQ